MPANRRGFLAGLAALAGVAATGTFAVERPAIVQNGVAVRDTSLIVPDEPVVLVAREMPRPVVPGLVNLLRVEVEQPATDLLEHTALGDAMTTFISTLPRPMRVHMEFDVAFGNEPAFMQQLKAALESKSGARLYIEPHAPPTLDQLARYLEKRDAEIDAPRANRRLLR